MNDIVRLTLSLDVTIKKNGVTEQELLEHLRTIAEGPLGKSIITGGSGATILSHDAHVMQVDNSINIS